MGLFTTEDNDREHHNRRGWDYLPCVTTTGSTITRKTIEESNNGEVAKQKSNEVSPTDDEHTPKHKGDGGGKRSRRDGVLRLAGPQPLVSLCWP